MNRPVAYVLLHWPKTGSRTVAAVRVFYTAQQVSGILRKRLSFVLAISFRAHTLLLATIFQAI